MTRLSFAKQLPQTQAAIEFAELHHARQLRATDRAPFLIHPVEVAALLARERYPDQVVAAAVLHDVLERTDVDQAELERRFGREVSDLVASVSDDASIADDDERKRDLLERVRKAGADAQAVYAADKVSRVRELRYLRAEGMPEAEAEATLRRHRASLAMLEEEVPDNRLVEILRFEVESLDALPPQGRVAES